MLVGCFASSQKSAPKNLILVPVVMEKQVADLQEGHSDAVKSGDVLQIRFKIWAYDPSQLEGKGRLIEESPPGKSASLKLGAKAVLPAWEESMVGMKVGGRRQVLLPPDQAYGRRQISDTLKASTPLIIEVEVLEKKASIEP